MSVPEWAWLLVDLAAAQAAGDADGMDAAFERLQAAGRQSETEEAVLQSYLFLGFPATIETFRRWRRHGAQTPEAAAEGPELWRKRGEQVCAAVYGPSYGNLRHNMARLHPDLDRWMVEEGYGKVLGRPALSLDIREMLIVAMLIVQGARRQLRSHLRGAINVGVEPGEVETIIDRAAAFAPAANVALAEKLWSVVLAKDLAG